MVPPFNINDHLPPQNIASSIHEDTKDRVSILLPKEDHQEKNKSIDERSKSALQHKLPPNPASHIHTHHEASAVPRSQIKCNQDGSTGTPKLRTFKPPKSSRIQSSVPTRQIHACVAHCQSCHFVILSSCHRNCD